MDACTVVDGSTAQPWETQGRVTARRLRQGHLGLGTHP